MQFTSGYSGINVTGQLGSSLNFTWTFKGSLKLAEWGTKQSMDDEVDDLLVSLSIRGLEPVVVPPLYDGRVNGSWDRRTNPGQVVYTLTSLRKEDSKFFVCKLTAVGLVPVPVFDTVQLIVRGNCQHFVQYVFVFVVSEHALKSFCLRNRGRLGNEGRPILLKVGTLSCYVDCNMRKFFYKQLPSNYLAHSTVAA